MRAARRVGVLVAGLALVAGCGTSPTTETADVGSTTTATTSTTVDAPSTTEQPVPSTTTAPATVPPSTIPPTTASPTTARPPSTAGRSVFVLGDSALLGASETVPAALPGWHVVFDAVGSRRLPQAIEVLRARRSEIGAVAVIQQGNNHLESEGSFGAQIDEAMRVLDGVDRVVWLTVAEKWPSRVEINSQIRAAAGRWPQIVVAEWAPLIAAHPEYAEDMLHLSAAGRIAIAELIAGAVTG
ncbi:hypothetical protein NHL50_18425 [Acidimicrobiia bacterium EGI L10123]|uniref:hypothetical protein n=1 Tax=Salinilacustrithrix flava TaxID=2957203 RepID=UPI003D7C25A7|nr:hypothetical protein [Acidimicrobiia bacterium EGI L10123]